MINKEGKVMWSIHWNEIKPIYLSAEQFKSLAFKLEASDYKKVPFFSSQRISTIGNTYSSYGNNAGRCELRVFNRVPKRYIYIASKAILDTVEDETSGLDAYNTVNSIFEKSNKKSIFSAFSGKKYVNEYKEIKLCVPTQISYLNEVFANRIMHNVFKADVSSAFPSQIVNKSLPTLHGLKRVKGRIKPSKDYPFAFYINSHHIAIYNELNTRNFDNRYYGKYYNQIYNDSVKEEETILCKASEYNLNEPFQYLYEHRSENKDFKFYMNACIGFFHRNENPILSMIAAVVIARCNYEMIKRCEQLSNENCIVLFIATDSIAWIGRESKVAVNNKYLGSFTYEAKQCDFYAVGPKAYQININGKVTTKYSGMKKDKQEHLLFGMLPDDSKYNDESIHQLAITKKGIYYPERIM